MGIHELTTSTYHPSVNGGVERVNHTMAQMLAMVCNEHQNDWDVHLPHVEYAYNSSVSAATGLALNEVHIGRLPRPALTVFDRFNGGAHQSLDRDHLAYCDLAREQQHAYELVREQHALTVARVNGRNSTLSDALLRRLKYVAGGWVWVYNTAATIRQGQRKGVGNKVLKEKLYLNWTGPFKIVAIGHVVATKTPPYHVTTEDIANPPILIDVAKMTGHQCVRGRGGAIAVLYETHWDSLLRPTWERELDLQAFRPHILSYWAAEPAQHQPHTRQYQ